MNVFNGDGTYEIIAGIDSCYKILHFYFSVMRLGIVVPYFVCGYFDVFRLDKIKLLALLCILESVAANFL
jgi:hypothetical protein